MKEKIVKNMGVGFHGECRVVRADYLGITELPMDAVKQSPDSQNRLMVAHSESGYHHYIDGGEGVVELYHTSNPLIKFLRVEADAYALLRHAKPKSDSQRHTTQEIGPGLHRISIDRENAPEGWRKVED